MPSMSARVCAGLALALVTIGCGGDDGATPDAAAIDAPADSVDAPVDAADGVALVGGLHGARALALVGGDVYYVTSGEPGVPTGTVERVAGAGGAAAVLASGQSHPYELRVTDRVYWTNEDFVAAGGSSVRAMPLAGGNSVGLASTDPGPRALAVDGTTAYFAVGGGDHRLLTVPLAGGPTRLLATAQNTVVDVEVDATDVYYLDATAGGGRIMRVAKVGGAPQELSRQSSGYGRLTSDATSLYWTSGREVVRVGKDGSGGRTLATADRALDAIAVDAAHVYVGEADVGAHDSRLLRAPLSGGALAPLTAATHAPRAIAVDDAAIYWADTDTIQRLAK